jgi:hypothetical protein
VGVAKVLAPGELALLGRREQPTVADLADVELQGVGRLEALVLAEGSVLGLLLFLFGVDEVEDGIGLTIERRVGKRMLHISPIGGRKRELEM